MNKTIIANDLSPLHTLYKVVHVDPVHGFPELPSGKVAKKVLRDDAAERVKRGKWDDTFIKPE